MSVVKTISTGRRSGFRLRRSKLLVRSGFKDIGNNSNLFIIFAILSIILMLLSLHKQRQLSSSIDQFKSRVSLLESIIKCNFERGSKVEDTAERLELIIGKSHHEWGNKVESIVERLESIIEKSDHEWGIKEEYIAKTKKMDLEKEEIINSTQNKSNPNQVSYDCAKPYIIGLVKITLQLLIGFGKVTVSLAIIVIKISIQLLIGLGKILVSLTTLLIKMIMWYLTGGLAR